MRRATLSTVLGQDFVNSDQYHKAVTQYSGQYLSMKLRMQRCDLSEG